LGCYRFWTDGERRRCGRRAGCAGRPKSCGAQCGDAGPVARDLGRRFMEPAQARDPTHAGELD